MKNTTKVIAKLDIRFVCHRSSYDIFEEYYEESCRIAFENYCEAIKQTMSPLSNQEEDEG